MKSLLSGVANRAIASVSRWPSFRRAIDAEIRQKTRELGFTFSAVDDATATQLDSIPSQTTKGERRMLYHLFQSLWTGRGDVIEIGPFLGGTSRAIAMGMQRNPRRDSSSKLFTYDRFQDYFESKDLVNFLEPLVASEDIRLEQIEGLGERAPFREIFELIHCEKDYFECIVPSDHGVPDLLDEVCGGHWMQLPENCETDAVFVDGCKSWFGTKYFMSIMAEAARPGALFIFQDFGWYTCFWLATFIETFSDQFELVGKVDNTYTFQLKSRLQRDEIECRFADSPEDAGRIQLGSLLDKQIDRAQRRGDSFGVVRHTMHKAAALAYLGETEEARSVLRSAEGLPDAAEHCVVMNQAWDSPTYSPGGPIKLGR